MSKTGKSAKPSSTDRQALRKRVKHFHHAFNKADWQACFVQIDPQLSENDKVRIEAYSKLMDVFKEAYGAVSIWLTRISMHPEGASKQGDKRPFAYVYVIWQDAAYGFHMFRERWVKDHGEWYTRVVGLVPNKQEMVAA